MHKFFLVILFVLSGLASSNAQCTVDSAAIGGAIPVFPPPETTDHPEFGINVPACAGQAFEFTITFAVPDTFNYPGPPALQLPMNYVQVASSGAISATIPGTTTAIPAPSWLSYSCFPNTCKFNKNTLGCMKLFGNVPAGATLDSFDLQIAATVNVAVFGSIPITVPKDLVPGYYRLRVYPVGSSKCMTNIEELTKNIYRVNASPNPFSYLTTLKIEVLQNEMVDFQVFNLMGQRVQNRRVQLFAGENQLEFDASDLPNGIYQYSVGNEKGHRTGKLAVNR